MPRHSSSQYVRTAPPRLLRSQLISTHVEIAPLSRSRILDHSCTRAHFIAWCHLKEKAAHGVDIRCIGGARISAHLMNDVSAESTDLHRFTRTMKTGSFFLRTYPKRESVRPMLADRTGVPVLHLVFITNRLCRDRAVKTYVCACVLVMVNCCKRDENLLSI